MPSFLRLSETLKSVRTLRQRARRGVTAVEFAIIAPVFFLFFIGLMEMSLMMLAQHLLENATFNASRRAKTGYIAEGKTQMETIMDVLDRELGSLSPLIDVARVSFTSTSYGQLSQIDLPGQGTTGLGVAEEVVVYTVSYPWHFFTPLIGDIMGDANGIINLSSRIVVRNEPYS